jgi:hypothetical protein
MQKNTRKASILIWSIFLSLIISITFISISTKINKSIRNNNDLKNQMHISNEVKNLLNSWSIQWIHLDQILENWDEILFDSNTTLKSNLKKNETAQVKFPTSSNISINLSYSWAIFYNTTGTSTLSWVINNSQSISSFSWILELTNLWWYLEYEVNADQSFLPQYSSYKIIKQIGNKQVIKQKGTIKNF